MEVWWITDLEPCSAANAWARPVSGTVASLGPVRPVHLRLSKSIDDASESVNIIQRCSVSWAVTCEVADNKPCSSAAVDDPWCDRCCTCASSADGTLKIWCRWIISRSLVCIYLYKVSICKNVSKSNLKDYKSSTQRLRLHTWDGTENVQFWYGPKKVGTGDRHSTLMSVLLSYYVNTKLILLS